MDDQTLGDMEKKIQFAADGLRLAGNLHLPHNRRPPLVIGAHGMLSNGDSPKQQALAEKCNEAGIAYFRFDHRGCGESEGIFAEVTTFPGRCRDLAAAIETMHACPEVGIPLGLFGSSMGGAACLWVAPEYDVSAIAVLAAPVRFDAIAIPDGYDTDPRLSGMKKTQMAFDVSDRLPRLSNILIFHGDSDRVVPFDNALEIYRTAAPPKELIRFTGGDHPVSDPSHQDEFICRCVEWFASRLLPAGLKKN